MLSEEALILIAAFAGLALLVLGVMEELWPSRPRHPRRPAPGRDPWRRARPAAPAVAAPAAPEPPAEVEPPIERLLIAQVDEAARPSTRTRSVAPPPPPELAPPEPPSPPAPPRAAPDTVDDVPVVAEPAGFDEWPAADEPPEPPPAPRDVEPVTEAARHVAPPAEPEAEPLRPAALEPAPTLDAEADVAPAAAPAAGGASAVERLASLWDEKRFTEVVGEGLALVDTGGLQADDATKAWGLIGLAKQALGDADGARAAFEEAIVAAAPADRSTWQRHLAALSLSMAQALLGRAQGGGALDNDERVTTIRSAINWLEGGIAVAAAEPALRETLAAAREALWPTYDEVINGLIQRQEFHSARRLLREALADEECPAALQPAFRELLSATFGGEIGQLTAEAIRRMQEGKEEEALTTLERAESLLATIPPDAIPAKRRQELERRLWWGYTKLGIRRVEGGMYEEALGPLMHALGFQGVGPERQEETRGSVVQALEGIVDARAPLIRRLTEEGDREGALAICDRLWTFMKDAMERGVSKDELAGALGRAQQLFDRLGRRQS